MKNIILENALILLNQTRILLKNLQLSGYFSGNLYKTL